MQPNRPSSAQLEQAARAGDPMARLHLGNQLIESPAGSAECERGLELLKLAAEGNNPPGSQFNNPPGQVPAAPAAQWLLGGFYLQNLSLPDGMTQACHWMGLAAQAGVGPALDRMANMYLRGIGGAFEPRRALDLVQRLADAGFQRATWETGYLKSTLDELADPPGAVAAFARACALGFPPAYYSLGLRFALGAGVEADPAFARALLLRAADANFPDALAAADELVPAQRAGEKAGQWHARLKDSHTRAGPLLQQLGGAGMVIPDGRDPAIDRLEAHFAGLQHPAFKISHEGRLVVARGSSERFCARPSAWKWLSQRPRVAISDDFVSREERAQIMSMVGGALMEPHKYTAADAHGAAENEFFTGKGMAFGALTSDVMVRCIERRIAESTDWEIDAVEPSSVISYKPGQEYRPHVDYFAEPSIAENRANLRDYGGQRVVTFLVCLQAAEEGGETYYPPVDLKVPHRAGTAALHYNTLPDGRVDELSLHHGLPVRRGEKWLLRTTLRANSRYVE